jgi:hypothetical protein
MNGQRICYTRAVAVLFSVMVLGCFALAPTAQAAGRPSSIVGLWNVHYYVGSNEDIPDLRSMA